MTAPADFLLSVIATAYNEQESIAEYLRRTSAVLKEHFPRYELIIVDDGSKDRTSHIVAEFQQHEKNIRLLRLSRNFGHEAAISAGFEKAVGDYVVIMDADLQDPPELIPEMVAKIREGYDSVAAERKARQRETWLKKATSRLFYKFAAKMTGLPIPDKVGDFRVMNRKVVEAIARMREQVRFMKMIYAYVGFHHATVQFDRPERFSGKTKYNYRKLMRAAFDAIISYSDRPLRYVSLGCVVFSIILFMLSGLAIVQKLVAGDQIEQGWTSLFVLISFMFSMLFIFLAVLSEYISRILVETKQRPLYYVAEELHSNHMDQHLTKNLYKRRKDDERKRVASCRF